MKNLIQFLVLAVITSTVVSCQGNEEADPLAEQLKIDTQTIETYLSDNGISNNKIRDGIYEVSITEGNGPEADAEKILEVEFSLKKFDTDEIFYEDESYIYIPNNGFYIEDVAGNFDGMNISVLELSVGDVSEFYLASRYAFGYSSGNLNGVVIKENQIVIATVELKAMRTEQQQKAHENELIKTEITALAMEADSLESGVYKITVEEGSGDEAIGENSEFVFDYEGSYINGEVFDSQDNVSFFLSQLIDGWQIGLIDLKPGANVILFIPSDVAYGAEGVIDNNGEVNIPSFSTLVFDVTIKSIK